ncbi:hypothetical protein ES703_124851 [subsurface metagenome]
MLTIPPPTAGNSASTGGCSPIRCESAVISRTLITPSPLTSARYKNSASLRGEISEIGYPAMYFARMSRSAKSTTPSSLRSPIKPGGGAVTATKLPVKPFTNTW